jgi:hypothetical protein
MIPYFYMNGVAVHHKIYHKEKKQMLFLTIDLKTLATISEVENNYSWPKCEKLFGDK